MPEFTWRAVDKDGRFQDGVISAISRPAALSALRDRDLVPVRLEEGAGISAGRGEGSSNGRIRLPFARRSGRVVDRGHIQAITSELAVMLRAGLPLDRALGVLVGMHRQTALAAVLEDLVGSVKSGKSLSSALATHGDLFGPFYVSMVKSGEAGGQLAEVMGRLAEHLERIRELRESVVSALIYPSILVVVAAISVVLMLGFVVPQFETLFAEMGDGLPLPTRLIVGFGHLMSDWWWLLLAATALTCALLIRWAATPSGRIRRDWILLALPVVGEVSRRYEAANFARSMGNLLGSGVPIVTAIHIASDTIGNRLLHAMLDGVIPKIKQGGRLAEALEPTQILTPMALNMVRLGEETGRLDEMLIEVARVFENEVRAGIRRLLTMLEPMLILVLGAVIAGIIVSILLGILSVNEMVL